MLGEKTLGEKLAKRLDEYAAAWTAHASVHHNEGRASDGRTAEIIGTVLTTIAKVIREVTQ
jgi:hypothetical protein